MKKNSQDRPSESTEAFSLPEIEPLQPLRFPTFQQLVEEDRAAQSKTPAARPLNDLFSGMLGTLEPLLADYLAHPEKYGRETHDLLEQLTHGSKSLEQLTPSERRLLNLATYDFFQAVPQKKEPPLVKEAAPTDPEETAEETEVEDDSGAEGDAGGSGPVPGVDVPVTELPAYWWLR